jgi:hypothetical protein
LQSICIGICMYSTYYKTPYSYVRYTESITTVASSHGNQLTLIAWICRDRCSKGSVAGDPTAISVLCPPARELVVLAHHGPNDANASELTARLRMPCPCPDVRTKNPVGPSARSPALNAVATGDFSRSRRGERGQGARSATTPANSYSTTQYQKLPTRCSVGTLYILHSNFPHDCFQAIVLDVLMNLDRHLCQMVEPPCCLCTETPRLPLASSH